MSNSIRRGSPTAPLSLTLCPSLPVSLPTVPSKVSFSACAFVVRAVFLIPLLHMSVPPSGPQLAPLYLLLNEGISVFASVNSPETLSLVFTLAVAIGTFN